MSPAERADPVVGRTGARFSGSARAAAGPPDDGDSPPVHADPAVGLTGARFGGLRRRRAAEAVGSWGAGAEEVRAAGAAAEIPQARRPDAAETMSADGDEAGPADPAPQRTPGAAHSHEADDEPPAHAPYAADAESPGHASHAAADEGAGHALRATDDASAADSPHAADEEAAGHALHAADRGLAADAPYAADEEAAGYASHAADERAGHAPRAADREPFDADDAWIGGVRVRPYVRTGGRTRPAVDLALEALVSVAPGAPEPLGADHQAVAELCAAPRSVAEIAALLEVPIGVARVLVGDLAQDGTVVVHATSGPDGPDATLMQRVLDGLRRL